MKKASAVKPISALAIDDLCGHYVSVRDVENLAKENTLYLRDEIITLVRKHGIVPDGAEKSLRLAGVEYQATVSFGESTKVDPAVVAKIQRALSALKKPGLFKRLFHIEMKFILAPDNADLQKQLPRNIRKMFERVVVSTEKTPTLKVEALKKTKKARGKKATA